MPDENQLPPAAVMVTHPLISSHHLDEVARVADRITVINRGRAIGSLDPTGSDIERAFFSMVYTHDEARQP